MKYRSGIIWIVGLALALLLAPALTGCSEKETVRIATKPMVEQFILGEMLALMVEKETGLKVELTKGVGGGTANIHPALVEGKFDMYPEYTGTAWTYVLKHTDHPDSEAMLKALKSEYEKMGLVWSAMYGFNNTYSLALRRDVAEQEGVRTYSDLARIAPKLVFGGEYDFYERDDGFKALSAAYGMTFKRTADMDIGLKYEAIASGKVDVMNVFTTDGKLTTASVAVLEDDKGFFPSYYCGTVVRQETLKRFPKLEGALRKLDNVLNDASMARLNAEVESKGRNERDVAREYLQGKGLLP